MSQSTDLMCMHGKLHYLGPGAMAVNNNKRRCIKSVTSVEGASIFCFFSLETSSGEPGSFLGSSDLVCRAEHRLRKIPRLHKQTQQNRCHRSETN